MPTAAKPQTAETHTPTGAANRARDLLANNGRNSANNNEGIRTGSPLHVCEMLLAERDALVAERDALRASLELIAAQGGMTLLGPREDVERFHEQGAAKAFADMADIAKSALAPKAGG